MSKHQLTHYNITEKQCPIVGITVSFRSPPDRHRRHLQWMTANEFLPSIHGTFFYVTVSPRCGGELLISYSYIEFHWMCWWLDCARAHFHSWSSWWRACHHLRGEKAVEKTDACAFGYIGPPCVRSFKIKSTESEPAQRFQVIIIFRSHIPF